MARNACKSRKISAYCSELESSLKELSEYRMERAREMLPAAEENLEIGQYKTFLNAL